MKILRSTVLSLIILISASAQAGPAVSGGSSPLTYSATLLQTIFSSPLVWQKIFGSIEKVQRIEQNQKSTTFQISTTEQVAVKNEQGTIVRWDSQPCDTIVTITNVATDVFIPKLEVTQVDFSQCPAVKN